MTGLVGPSPPPPRQVTSLVPPSLTPSRRCTSVLAGRPSDPMSRHNLSSRAKRQFSAAHVRAHHASPNDRPWQASSHRASPAQTTGLFRSCACRAASCQDDRPNLDAPNRSFSVRTKRRAWSPLVMPIRSRAKPCRTAPCQTTGQDVPPARRAAPNEMPTDPTCNTSLTEER